MAFYDLAKAIVCNIVAVALAMTVTAVETLLPGRPDWLERVDALALQLKAIYEKDRAQRNGDPRPAAAPVAENVAAAPEPASAPSGDTERLLKAYNQLWQFVHDVCSEGLLLDDKFCERVEREWTVRTLMAYMRSADRSLQDKAGETLDAAAGYLAAPGSDSHRPV